MNPQAFRSRKKDHGTTKHFHCCSKKCAGPCARSQDTFTSLATDVMATPKCGVLMFALGALTGPTPTDRAPTNGGGVRETTATDAGLIGVAVLTT